MKLKNLVSLIIVLTVVGIAGADIATFDDNYLAPESYWNGSDNSGGFTSGDASFPNSYTDWGGGSYSWDGFAYSNTTDTTTPGVVNQYSAITGGGVNGSANYGVSYIPMGWSSPYDPIPQTVSFGAVTGHDYNTTISGAFITNTTYAALDMQNGSGFSKKFEAGDWFKLIVKGITESGYTANTVEFYLADFQNGNSYIVDEWTWVDFTSFGDVVGLEFSLASSDNGTYGMNTPAYFAMDDLNGVPEPMTIAILGLGGLLLRRRKA